jgi:hypothetical protein
MDIGMVSRRKALISIGGTVGFTSIAGCLGNDPIEIQVEDREGNPIENAEIEVEEDTLFPDTVAEGKTDESGIFVADVDSDESYTLYISHDNFGSKNKEVDIEDTQQTSIILPEVKINIQNNNGEPITNAEYSIYTDGLGGETIDSGTTDESGKIKANVGTSRTYKVEVSKNSYISKELEFEGETQTTITLLSNDNPEGIENLVEEVLESETDEVNEIEVETDEDIEVNANVELTPWEVSESEYTDEAADIIEQIFDLEVDINYFEIEIYTPTTDEYGNEGTARAITIGMDKETADRINWDNYDSDNLSYHADTYDVSPTLILSESDISI